MTGSIGLDAEPGALGKRMRRLLWSALAMIAAVVLVETLLGITLARGLHQDAAVERVLGAQMRAAERISAIAGRMDRPFPAAKFDAFVSQIAAFDERRTALAAMAAQGRGVRRGVLWAHLFNAQRDLDGRMRAFAADALMLAAARDPGSLRDARRAVALSGPQGSLSGFEEMLEAFRAEREERRTLQANVLGAMRVALLTLLAGIGIIIVRRLVRDVLAGMRRVIAAHDAVQHAAFHDPLTGLPNRESFLLQLDVTLSDPALTGQIVAVVEIDLMCFEDETAPYGRALADEAKCRLAERLTGLARADGLYARDDGARFLAAFTDLLDEAELRDLGRELHAALTAPLRFGMVELHAGPAIGIAPCVGGETMAFQAVLDAQAAAALARGAGPGAVEILTEAGRDAARMRRDQVAQVGTGGRSSHALRFWPQIALDGGHLAGLHVAVVALGESRPAPEGQVREAGAGGAEPKDAPLGHVEAAGADNPLAASPGAREGDAAAGARDRAAPGETGVCAPLFSDERIRLRRRAIALIGGWCELAIGPPWFSLDVHADDLMEADFADGFLLDLDAAGIEASRVMLRLPAEASAGRARSRGSAAAKNLARLEAAGVRFLHRVSRGVPVLPVDGAAVTPSVTGLVLDAAAGAPGESVEIALKAVARHAEATGLISIAEGLHDAAALAAARRAGVVLGAGSAVARGLDEWAAQEYLRGAPRASGALAQKRGRG